jgi:hypothetical protein
MPLAHCETSSSVPAVTEKAPKEVIRAIEIEPARAFDPKATFDGPALTGSSCSEADLHEGKQDRPSWVQAV